MSRKPATAALLALALALGVTPAAMAAAPYDLDAGVRVSDTTSVLGDTSSLEDAISQLASDEQVNLFVVTIDQFESPSSSSEWTSNFATLNNMGTNDVVLVIATEARQAYFMAGSTSVLSNSQQEKIYQTYIYPELANSDYAAAARAAVTGIESELGSGSVVSGVSGALAGGVTLLGVAALAGGGAWALSRSRASARKNTGSSRSGRLAPSQPLPSIEELRSRAGVQLVATDDAIAHSQQEVEFARLQYGDDEVKPFLAAIDAAKNHMQRSFQLQKQLDDEIPDTEADQRAWLNEILARTEDAQKALNEQVANFTNLRKLEETAPQALATLNQGIVSATPLFPAAQASLDRLGTLYSPSAFGAVADNISEAQARLDFARQEATEAEELLTSQRSQAILALRAGEEALGQAKGLLESIHHVETDLGKMAASLDNALILADRDVAQAQELARTGAGSSSSQLSGAAAGVQAVLGQIRAERAAGLIDPYLLNQRLHEVRSDLDAALDTVRQTHEQERSARETLGHALVSAQAQVSSASEYVWARRGGIKAEARTRLREAERHLTEAQQLQHSEPISALSHANDAIRLAGEAQRIARSDVDRFNQRNGYSGSGNYNSAMLGGILLGTLLGGSNHSSSGGFGSGGFGSGGFGGGMGGGTFGGGFGGGGSWGGGGGAGGNF